MIVDGENKGRESPFEYRCKHMYSSIHSFSSSCIRLRSTH